VQDKILAIGREHLSERGVLYVSYNTHPGWYLRGVVRDMMKYHVALFEDPRDKIAQARSLLDFLKESDQSGSETYRQLLKDEAEILARQSDSYLFHEHLEEVNEPLYFSEFIRRAEASGLRYLGETEFATMLAENFEESTATILQEASLLRQEQYMDFLRARMFRGTLLCRAELVPDRDVSVDRLSRLQLGAGERLDLSGLDLTSTESVEIKMQGRNVSTSAPLTKQALAILVQTFPATVPMADLCDTAAAACGGADFDQLRLLREDLMTLYSKGVIRAVMDPPPFLTIPSDLPRATPLARAQAAQALPVTNRVHENVALDPVHRWTLQHLDGHHSVEDLIRLFSSAVQRGEFEVMEDGHPIEECNSDIGGRVIQHALNVLAENALLIA
jgi:methyltransferase-like protein